MVDVRAYIEMTVRACIELAGTAVRGSLREQHVLEHGRAFTWAPLRSGMQRGKTGECYRNANTTLWDLAYDDFFYCEGYAASAKVGIPVMHAWVVDGDGNAYDLTWPGEGHTYFGIPFDTRWLAEWVSNTEVFGVLPNDHDILQYGVPLEAIAQPFRQESTR